MSRLQWIFFLTKNVLRIRNPISSPISVSRSCKRSKRWLLIAHLLKSFEKQAFYKTAEERHDLTERIFAVSICCVLVGVCILTPDKSIIGTPEEFSIPLQ